MNIKDNCILTKFYCFFIKFIKAINFGAFKNYSKVKTESEINNIVFEKKDFKK